MAVQATAWHPHADFGELRQTVEEMTHGAGSGRDGDRTPSVKDGVLEVSIPLPAPRPKSGSR